MKMLEAQFPPPTELKMGFRAMGVSPSPIAVYWRFRASHPWTIEEFAGRDEAYRRYFYLLDRGVEVQIQPAGR